MSGWLSRQSAWRRRGRHDMADSGPMTPTDRAEIAALREALRKYGHHDEDCQSEAWHRPPTPEERPQYPCTCGLQYAIGPDPGAPLRAVVEAAREVMLLIDDGLLVRNTTNDSHLPSYLKEAARIVKTIGALQAALDGGTG